MRILVLGGGGMLASTLVPFLRSKGDYVEVSSRDKGTATVQVDPFDFDSMRARLVESKFDYVLNLIGLTSVEDCQANPSRALRINGLPSQVFRDVVDANPSIESKWVQISSDHLYDGTGPSTESELRVVNFYAASKLASEMPQRPERDLTLRVNFVGPSKAEGRESLTDWVMRSLTYGEGPVPVLHDVTFSPLTMGQLSSLIHTSLNLGLTGTYNLGASGFMSKAEFDRKFAEGMSLQTSQLVEIDLASAKFLTAPRPRRMEMDSQLFSARTGLQLPTIFEVLEDAIREHKEES